MKTEHKYWTIQKLLENIDNIEFPEFQREPTVWKLEKKQRLIDSILRDFDISSIYFYEKGNGGYDCIDGRQRINAILSYLGINGADEDDNEFHLKIENEIYNDGDTFKDADAKRYAALKNTPWGEGIRNYKLNVVEISDIENDEELNLLFLRLQIAAVLNAGEKLHAMTGDMRDVIFYKIGKHDFFKKINIPERRFAKEQVAAQIVLNDFSERDEGIFHRSRYVDLQDFFKQYSKFSPEDRKNIESIIEKLDEIDRHFDDKLSYIKNRAIAVSVYLMVRHLIEGGKKEEIDDFVKFFVMFLKTLKWQLPLGVQMHPAYYDLLKFQTNISQAAGEKSAIDRRHDFLGEYFYYFKEKGLIKGDLDYKNGENKNPDFERNSVQL